MTGESGGRSAVERAYEEFLGRLESGEALDIEALCAEHPGISRELRDLYALDVELTGLPRSTQSTTTDPSSGPWPHLNWGALLRRLAARRHGDERYELQGEIERGGQGAILRVWDEDLQRVLAMKVLLGPDSESPRDPGTDSRSLGRFIEEAQVTGQLDHPGIVPVHEMGLNAEGRCFFTMKLVKGDTFKTVLEHTIAGAEGWTPTRALTVLARVCEAMSYAHHKSVVHRDLKPANIMVGRFGEVYVMDWGLARVLGRDDSKDVTIRPAPETLELRSVRRDRAEATPDSPLLTMDGDVVGTPAYMPPEQALGNAERIGPHSDVYAVGAMLYHLLAGHKPYELPGMRLSGYDTWYQVQKGPPDPVTERAPGAPVELVSICERAMEREIDRRYPDMHALAADLSAYLENRVVLAYETGAWAEARKWVQRNKAFASALAAALLLLVGGLVASLTFKARADGQAEENKELARIATVRANHILSLSASKDVESLVRRAQTLWPAQPHMIDEYERWLVEAHELINGRTDDPQRGTTARPSLAEHRAELTELRARAISESPAALLEKRSEHPRYPEYESVASERLWYARMLGREPWPSLAEVEAESSPKYASASPERLNVLAWEIVDPTAPVHGEETQALLMIERSLALTDKDLPEKLDTMAWTLFRLGRLDEALATERRAAETASALLEEKFREYGARLEQAVAAWQGADELEARRAREVELVAQMAALEAEFQRPWRFEFDNPEDGWWHTLLANLVLDIETFSNPETGLVGNTLAQPFGWGITRRLESARTLAERSLEGPVAKVLWAEALAAIATAPEYAGLELVPQLGLLPIGPDPVSGFWEFTHLQTGEPVERGASGVLELTEDSGLVFVLLPGGTFLMGEQSVDSLRANYGLAVRNTEVPAHEVELLPWFISKYEMNQAQWERVAAHNPSALQPPDWGASSRLHPVEQVSWDDCVDILGRFGLCLPTEAQWEYAARGGTHTAWSTGDLRESLIGAVNMADRSATRTGAKWNVPHKWPAFDDGFPLTAPVNRFGPNPFGLFSVHGNVKEWCEDAYYGGFYGRSPRREPVGEWTPQTSRVHRGGCFSASFVAARSSSREFSSPETRSRLLGLRPARRLDPSPDPLATGDE